MSSVVECLEQLGQLASISQLEKEMGRGHRWIRPGLREGGKKGLVIIEGKAKNTKYRRSTPAEEAAAKATLFDGREFKPPRKWDDDVPDKDPNDIPMGD